MQEKSGSRAAEIAVQVMEPKESRLAWKGERGEKRRSSGGNVVLGAACTVILRNVYQ